MGKLVRQAISPKFISIAKDIRSSVEKERDYIYGDDVKLPGSSAASKRITKLPIVPYNQGATSACGAFSASHARLIFESEKNFPLAWYRARSNYPQEGMFLQDVLRLAAKANAITTPAKYKALRPNEEEANKLQLQNLFENARGDNYEYAQIKPYDSDSVVEVSNNGFPVVISFFCTKEEWVEEMEPRDPVILMTAPVRHFVVVLPNSHHFKDGKWWVSVVDSSPANGFALRHLSLDFLSKRMYLGGGFYYPATKKKAKKKVVPVFSCSFGQRNQAVRTLQEFLVTEGLMSEVHTTGYYGPITAKAVLSWQMKNLELPGVDVVEIQDLMGYHWGPRSIARAKELYQ